MTNSLVFVWIRNEECIRRVDVFFSPDPKDRLRLSFPILLSQCKYFHATVGYGRELSYTYIWKGLRVVGCGFEMLGNIPKPGRLN